MLAASQQQRGSDVDVEAAVLFIDEMLGGGNTANGEFCDQLCLQMSSTSAVFFRRVAIALVTRRGGVAWAEGLLSALLRRVSATLPPPSVGAHYSVWHTLSLIDDILRLQPNAQGGGGSLCGAEVHARLVKCGMDAAAAYLAKMILRHSAAT